MNLAWHVRQVGDIELPACSWRPPAPVRVASTSVLGGGIGERAWFLNATVPVAFAADDPAVELRALAASVGLAGEGVGMLTAKDVRRAVVEEEGGVEVVATVGLGWPTWAAAPSDAVARVTGAGTVNLLAVVPATLGDGALVNAVATATEAKVQALLEAGVAGTGTASDAVRVAALGGDGVEAYGGPRSRSGSPLACAVHRAVLPGRGMIALVLGGARSGKSAFAERLAGSLVRPVTYVATGTASDDDMAERIARHRARRQADWCTEEVGADLVVGLDRISGTVLVDSLGSWVAACDMAPDVGALVEALRRRSGDAVLVSEEVGLGVHPPTALGVRFRDAVGEVNAAVAEVADDVRLVVAGRGLRLDRLEP